MVASTIAPSGALASLTRVSRSGGGSRRTFRYLTRELLSVASSGSPSASTPTTPGTGTTLRSGRCGSSAAIRNAWGWGSADWTFSSTPRTRLRSNGVPSLARLGWRLSLGRLSLSTRVMPRTSAWRSSPRSSLPLTPSIFTATAPPWNMPCSSATDGRTSGLASQVASPSWRRVQSRAKAKARTRRVRLRLPPLAVLRRWRRS
mmetsp:Transcript_46733/g.99837  ORF Transcript_46733/g.99837 Transcript_46733/m.99837 type:complete len:203 (-) Transcript_46733:223-831(-)